ncbi:MAG: hypothetical protein JWQ71_1922 [Pedosphaera sp.]|nr:hypothetical protein [Pedosphaera sp.]
MHSRRMLFGRTSLICLFLFFSHFGFAANAPEAESPSLALPKPGTHQLQCVSPTILELSLVTTKQPDPAHIKEWDFADANGQLHLPDPKDFRVSVGGSNIAVTAIGFKRRVLYAPLKKRDLRIGSYLYLKLAAPIADQQTVEVKANNPKLLPANLTLSSTLEPLRWSPATHVNQTGYSPNSPKIAMVGYFLGSLGEMELNSSSQPLVFKIMGKQTGKQVYQGRLKLRADHGFPAANYQRVWEADFSEFKSAGEYQLQIPGLGTSFPFFINEGTAAAFARTYALGLYHQRCGTSNALPFTRFTHDACHTALAEVPIPQSAFKTTWEILADKTTDVKDTPRHTAPPLKDAASQLYPFVKRGKINVSGGHHDAGDYSKYTINSAALIHQLMFAVDSFPGASELDNLGIPESGDGKSDVLQEAKWEADFLAKMQDEDGGFYFLVYPREREYENEVTPDHGDAQVVWPKTTATTAAAVAALAQCASSPTMKKQFPEAAALYFKKAKAGWIFLERAIQKYGQDGAYQKITHYGNEFMHDDELAWAACELFIATGDATYDKKLSSWLNPASGDIRKWGWLRMYESYGCAIRSYAFAARVGKLKREQLDPALLAKCENEIIAAAQEQLTRAEDSAYGTSFPEETKRSRSAGWYFSGDAAFDLAVACQLDYPSQNDPRPKFMRAIWSNLNYEAGCNPVNVCYLTGLGWKRQRETVNQYAQNSRRVLPPTGIPLGNIQGGFGWLDPYKKELGEISFPQDGSESAPYPFYDRWGDSFNLGQEFVIVNQARSLAYLAWLMAQTPLKDQKWTSVRAQITGLPEKCKIQQAVTTKVEAQGLDLKDARIVWEARDQEPAFGNHFTFKSAAAGPQWVEVEAQLPDGRRAFASTNFIAR